MMMVQAIQNSPCTVVRTYQSYLLATPWTLKMHYHIRKHKVDLVDLLESQGTSRKPTRHSAPSEPSALAAVVWLAKCQSCDQTQWSLSSPGQGVWSPMRVWSTLTTSERTKATHVCGGKYSTVESPYVSGRNVYSEFSHEVSVTLIRGLHSATGQEVWGLKLLLC